jgi:hypothetical protein
MAAEAVVGVTTAGGGAVFAGWLVPVLQPLRTRERIDAAAASFETVAMFRIMSFLRRNEVSVPHHFEEVFDSVCLPELNG